MKKTEQHKTGGDLSCNSDLLTGSLASKHRQHVLQSMHCQGYSLALLESRIEYPIHVGCAKNRNNKLYASMKKDDKLL